MNCTQSAQFIDRAWQADGCKDIQPKLKSNSFDTHKRALLNESGDLGRRITSPCDWKAKGVATDVLHQLKQNTLDQQITGACRKSYAGKGVQSPRQVKKE